MFQKVLLATAAALAAGSSEEGAGKIVVIRHSDRRDSYPEDPIDWGNNTPMSIVTGGLQSDAITERLVDAYGNFTEVYSSPFVRCIESSISMATAMGVSVKVEDAIAEDRESRPCDDISEFLTREEQAAIANIQDDVYSSFYDLQTPETDAMYYRRVRAGAQHIMRAVPATENAALFTHSVAVWSLVHGMCEGYFVEQEMSADDFYEWIDPVAVGGYVVVHRNRAGRCVRVDQVNNSIFEDIPGATQPNKAGREAYLPM